MALHFPGLQQHIADGVANFLGLGCSLVPTAYDSLIYKAETIAVIFIKITFWK